MRRHIADSGAVDLRDRLGGKRAPIVRFGAGMSRADTVRLLVRAGGAWGAGGFAQTASGIPGPGRWGIAASSSSAAGCRGPQVRRSAGGPAQACSPARRGNFSMVRLAPASAPGPPAACPYPGVGAAAAASSVTR